MRKIVLAVEGGVFVVTLYMLLSFVSAITSGTKSEGAAEWLLSLWVLGVAPIAFLSFVVFVMRAQWAIVKADYWLLGAVLLSCVMIFHSWGMHSFAFKAAASSLGATVVMLLGYVRFKRLSSPRHE